MSRFGDNSILFLLGAGASKDAGIPHAREMVEEIESLLDDDFNQYKDLFNYIKSALIYADGLQGKFSLNSLNIERLVGTLDEILKRQEHTLYPFVGAWNERLRELAGPNFTYVRSLRQAILTRLKTNWIPIRVNDDAEYYSGLIRFKQETNFMLRVFSLNYDLCVETICGRELSIERGFLDRIWRYQQFENETNDPKDIYLYKLHGSIDWVYTGDNRDKHLTYNDDFGHVNPEDIAIIFGTTYKLQYRDPFLYFTYQLRRMTMEDAMVVVCIGYGFNDPHINSILRQSLLADEERLILSVGPTQGYDDEWAQEVATRLRLEDDSQIRVCDSNADSFLLDTLSLDYLESLFGEEEDLFPTIELDDE